MTAVLGLTAGIALSAPAVAATACPQCYGAVRAWRGVYADRDDGPYRQLLDAADPRITAFYGTRLSHPRVSICATAACYRRMGGGREKGKAIWNWSLLLSPAGANETIVTDELSHVEFHERLGSAQRKVPHWFDEGCRTRPRRLPLLETGMGSSTGAGGTGGRLSTCDRR